MAHSVRPGQATWSRRRWRGTAGAVLVVVALGVAACSPGAPSRAEFVDALRTTGLSEADAACVADAVLDELTEDEVALIADRGPSGAPVDDDTQGRDSLARVRATIAACAVTVAVPGVVDAADGTEVDTGAGPEAGDEPDPAVDGADPADGSEPADGADPVEGVVSPDDDPSPTAPDGEEPPEGVGP